MNSPSLFKAAMQARCPRCGEGALFVGYLRVVPICGYCGQSFANFATDDGPASLIVLPLCFLTAGGSLVLEIMAKPPMWVHILIWPAFIALVVGFSLRPVKAAMIALQYRARVRNGETSDAAMTEPVAKKNRPDHLSNDQLVLEDRK